VEITEVRIKLMDEPGERLKAFCSITFDDAFVVRDLKIIEGSNGPFVAMPSRKLTAHCPSCGCKNHLRAAYCNQCGKPLREVIPAKDEEGRSKLYADIAHPINSACREMIQGRVIESFDKEKTAAQMPGYVSRYEDLDVQVAVSQSPDPEQPRRPESAEVQPAEKPRGPHRTPSRQDEPAKRSDSSTFGAGIFD
jgi:stage V sporulation protein G